MPAAGETFAGYAIRRSLGHGTSGTVFLASDPRADGWVALKVLHPPGGMAPEDYEDVRARFLQESQVALRLRHPGIVAVLGAGDEAGLLWIAMELVPGCSLERYVQPRMLLPPPVAVDVVSRVAQALAHAHAAGVVHRDLKPSNVLVDLPSGVVKLSDFGTAQFADGKRTRTGVMLGTPSYMAPEQLAGAPADARGDLYSLGVLLFELLTGHRPHESASMGEFLRSVATQPAPDLREFWPAASDDLARTLAGLLARQPSGRPAGAADVLPALARARVHMTADSGPP